MASDTSFLNFFRALAALWVVVAHCFIWAFGNVDPWHLLEPKKAVDLFMVISGFLMMLTIDKHAGRESPFLWSTWRSFYIRRLFRIAPVYYVALATVVLAWPVISEGWIALQQMHPERWVNDRTYAPEYQDFSLLSMILHVTFLFGLFPDYSFSTALPDWSLSLEMQFYAVFPLIYIAARKRPMWQIVVVLGISALVATKAYFVGVPRGWWPAYDEPSLLLFKLPMFLVGAMIYESRKRPGLAYSAVTAGLFVAAARVHGPSAVSLIAIVALLAWAWLKPVPALVTAMFRSRLVTFMSEVSYGAYLVHGFVIALLGASFLTFLRDRGWSDLSAASVFSIVVVAITYVLSWAVYSFVELPGIALGRRVANARKAEIVINESAAR